MSPASSDKTLVPQLLLDVTGDGFGTRNVAITAAGAGFGGVGGYTPGEAIRIYTGIGYLDGIVHELATHTVGGVVGPGKPLMFIVRSPMR